MWRALREIGRGTTLYYKQLTFFTVIAGISLVGNFFRETLFSAQNVPQAATVLPQSLAPQSSGPQAYQIEMTESGEVRVNGRKLRRPFVFEGTGSKFLLILVQESVVPIDLIRIHVALPKAVEHETLKPRIYAVHGVGTASYQAVSPTDIEFVATDIFEGATVSIELTFPEGYFAFSGVSRLSERLGTLTVSSWSLLALTLPFLTALFLLGLLIKRWSAVARLSSRASTPTPPSALPPAVVGVLYNGKIGKREVTATLLDLARRGFLYMHYDSAEQQVKFAKGQNLFTQEAKSLRPFEVLLLHQIFGEDEFVSSESKVLGGLDQDLFNSKVAMVFVNVYDAAVAEGFFVDSPNAYFIKYRLTGLVCFFLSLAALLYESLVIAVPSFSLFLWVGMLMASLLIIGLTPGIPPRAKAGNDALKQWLQFRNYLTDSRPIAPNSAHEFFVYLPYALVLGCTDAWMARFKDAPTAMPKWFSSDGALYRTSDYTQSLVSLVNILSRQLASVRPPDLA